MGYENLQSDHSVSLCEILFHILQLIVGHITACMMVSNENHEEDCHKIWVQLIVGLNKDFYDVEWWKHSVEVAHKQLQVKVGTPSCK